MSDAVLVVLSVLGAAALVLRAAGAGGRILLAVAESTAADGMAEVSARRGDVTALRDRREMARQARRRRALETFWFLLWTALLVVPILAGVMRPVYPAAAALWLLPRRRTVRVAPPPS